MSNFKEDKGAHMKTHEIPKIYDPEIEPLKYARQRKEFNPTNKEKPFTDKANAESKHRAKGKCIDQI
jgi:hypothetical protein